MGKVSILKPNSKSKCVSRHTILKQEKFVTLLNTIVDTLDKKQTYCYWDLNGGPGYWDIDGQIFAGSPLIAHAVFSQLPFYRALIFEAAKSSFNLLATVVKDFADDRITVQNHNNENCYDLYKNKLRINTNRGLIYYDPGESPKYKVPLDASKAAPNYDILVHVAPCLTKRNINRCNVRGTILNNDFKMSIMDYISASKKKHHYITEKPDAKQQFVMLYSTDDPEFRPPQGWLSCRSRTAKQLLTQLTKTKAELGLKKRSKVS